MKHLLRLEEWQDSSGYWYCADTSDLINDSSAWWKIMRMLGLSAKSYIKLLISEFAPDHLYYYKPKNLLVYSWNEDKQAEMRKFKNFINKKAREANYYI